MIKGYRAVIDSAELGLLVTAFVAIKPFDPSQADDAPDRLQHITEIISCYSVAGEPSYLLKVQVPLDGPPGVVARTDPLRRRGLHPHHDRVVGPVRGPRPDLSAEAAVAGELASGAGTMAR